MKREEIRVLKESISRILKPIKPAKKGGSFAGDRRVGNQGALPPYYILFIVLHELLGYKNLGRQEKIAWVIPIEFKKHIFTLEYRKLGIALVSSPYEGVEADAEQIIRKLKKACRLGERFIEHYIESQIIDSKINIKNYSNELYDRFDYLRNRALRLYRRSQLPLPPKVTSRERNAFGEVTTYQFLTFQHYRSAEWMAFAALDAYFSYTEHVFVLLAALTGIADKGVALKKIIRMSWSEKYKTLFDLRRLDAKSHYDEMGILRENVKNYMSHGAFGKRDEALQVHSSTGAIPVYYRRGFNDIGLSAFGLSGYTIVEAFETIERFESYLWKGKRAPAKIYCESSLPVVLPDAIVGKTKLAMSSKRAMRDFVDYMTYIWDQSANMDW